MALTPIEFAKRVWANLPTKTTSIDASALQRLENATQDVVDRLNDDAAMASKDAGDYQTTAVSNDAYAPVSNVAATAAAQAQANAAVGLAIVLGA